MPDLPSIHAAGTILITIVVFVLFAQGRIRIEVICLGLIAVLAVGFHFFPFVRAGQYTSFEVAFGGFSHEALVAICCLMILGRGLVVTGALEPAARAMARLWRFSRIIGMLCTLLACMVLSAFVNDTPILILVLPVMLNLVSRVDVPASKTLMPVNAAILIGGTATAIGTSTNVLVLSIAEDMGVDSIGIFTFTPTVALAALVALPYLWLVMPRLLPNRDTGPAGSPRPYQAYLHMTDSLVAAGKPLEWLLKKVGNTVAVIGVTRGDLAIAVDDPGVILLPGDRVQVSGTMNNLHEASDLLKAPLANPKFIDAVRDEAGRRKTDRQMAELVVGPDSPLIGETLSRARLPERFGVVVLGTYRTDVALLTTVHYPLEERFQAGDLLLVHGTAEGLTAIEAEEKLMLLGSARDLPEPRQAPIAVAIVVSVILIATLKIVPIAISALAGAIAMLVTRCVQFERIGRALSSEVIVVVAASIALGRALVETGAALWLGSLFATVFASAHPATVLVAVMAFVTVMTNFVSNAAAAAVGTPLAITLANQLSIPAEPMVLAVLFGANLSYVTPMAYQTNLIIMGPGGYRFSDYVRAGLPLALIMITTLAFLLVRRYGL